jgi:hypothetical protein
MMKCGVFFEVRTEFLNIIQTSVDFRVRPQEHTKAENRAGRGKVPICKVHTILERE